jgi:fermentation-respiration switch protein FrsA (DUF1100 family)
MFSQKQVRHFKKVKKLLLLPLLATLPAYLVSAQDIAGDWQGTLKPSSGELRIVLHVAKYFGGFKASMDSVDAGANGMPVTAISLEDTKLNFEVASIGGSYEGKVNADASLIRGEWSQSGLSFPLDFKRQTTPIKTEHKPAKPSDIDGAWQGNVDMGALKVRGIFHFVNTDDGLTATLDLPDQNATSMPAASVVRNGASIAVEVKALGGRFEGKFSDDLKTLDGTWSQSGQSKPLVLQRVTDAAQLERKRPQNPVKPYPYSAEDLTYENKVAGIKLAATLTIPRGKGPFPAVVLITGSGPQDRDESLLGHKPFLVLSDYLTRHGIAVLRADDRGIAKSGGVFGTATTADFATDAEAGVAYLKTRSEVNPRKIGLIGHSEGGVIAPMVAARNPDVAFIVMMAGTGVSGHEILVAQRRLISEAAGDSPENLDKGDAQQRALLTLVEQEKDDAVLEKKARELLAGSVPEAQIAPQIKAISSPWFRYFLTYDPAPALSKLKCPVLVINGEKDLQVPPKQNLPAIRKALQAGGNKDFEIDELPSLNHLFQTAKTGAPTEYAEIEETIAPIALEKMATWIAAH